MPACSTTMKPAAPSSTCAPRSTPCARPERPPRHQIGQIRTLDLVSARSNAAGNRQAARPDRSAGQRDRQRAKAPERPVRRPRRPHPQARAARSETIDGKTAQSLPNEKRHLRSGDGSSRPATTRAGTALQDRVCDALSGLGLRAQRPVLAGQRLLCPARLQERDHRPGSGGARTTDSPRRRKRCSTSPATTPS
jgi:hypothetical protein